MHKDLPIPSLASAENELYLKPKGYLDFTDAAPQGVNPTWINNLLAKSSLGAIVAEDPKVLIENIKTYFKKTLNIDDVELTYSAGFSFLHVLMTLLSSKQNEIIILEPGFQIFSNLIKLYGGKPVYVQRESDNGVSIETLKKACTSKTAGIIIINPDNPTGKVYPKEIIEKIADICIKKDIALIYDQCFIKHPIFVVKVPLLSDLKSFAKLKYFLICDTGKTLGLKGIKIGAVASSDHYKEKIQTILRLHFFQYNQASLYILSEILTNKKFEDYLDDFNSLIKSNFEYLLSNLHPSLSVLKPDGATVCLIDISKTGKKDFEFNNLLKQKYKLAMNPLSLFYNSSTTINHNYLRIPLARPSGLVKEAAHKINLLTVSLIPSKSN